MKRQAHVAGYTLLELMIVVGLLGAMSLITAASVSSWRGDARQQNAAYSILRLTQQAQGLATRSGHSHMLRLSAGDNGRGLLTLLGGMNYSCLKTPWTLATEVGRYNMDSAVPGGSSRELKLTAEVNGANVDTLDLCVEPSGRTFAGPTGAMAVASGLTVLSVTGYNNSGVVTGTVRRVIFEPGGRARMQR